MVETRGNGGPLPTADLTSAQRSAQMDRVVDQVAKLSLANNELSAQVRALQFALKAEEQDRLADRAVLDGFTGMPVLARLRWLVRR